MQQKTCVKLQPEELESYATTSFAYQTSPMTPVDYVKYHTKKFGQLRLEHSLAQICRSSRSKYPHSPESKNISLSGIHLRKKYLADHERCQQQLLKDDLNFSLRPFEVSVPHSRYFRQIKIMPKLIKKSEVKLLKKVMYKASQHEILLPSIVSYNTQQASDRFKYKKPRDVYINKKSENHNKSISKSRLQPNKLRIDLSNKSKTTTIYDKQLTTRSRVLQVQPLEKPVELEQKRGSLEMDNTVFEDQVRLESEVKQFLAKYRAKLR